MQAFASVFRPGQQRGQEDTILSAALSLSVPLTPPYDTLRQWVIKCQQFYI